MRSSEFLEAIGLRNGVLAVVRAAFDASACQNPKWIYAIGGLVGPTEAWDPLLEQWQAAVDQWRIPTFHLSHLRKMLGLERAQMCEGYFLDLLRECELDPVGAAILTAHWELPDWGHDTSPRFGTAYEQSLWFALKAVAGHCQNRFPGQEVAVLCDIDASEAAMNAIFKKAQAEFPNLDSLTVSTSARHKELQCADLAAGYLRRSWVEITDNPKSQVPWGQLPKTKGKATSSVWSLAGGYFIGRAMRIHGEEQEKARAARED